LVEVAKKQIGRSKLLEENSVRCSLLEGNTDPRVTVIIRVNGANS
jgi:hypothetical protein